MKRGRGEWRTVTRPCARRVTQVALACLAISLCAGVVRAQTLEVVLFRVQEYLAQYEHTLSGVVSEEHYHQEIRRGDRVRRTRDLQSDVLMVWVQEDQGWTVFRDVFQVNEREVRDRQTRLEELFVAALDKEEAFGQAKEIAEESSRFNIGDIQRNFNVPTMALRFLHPTITPRLSFEKAGEETVNGIATWEIRFAEYTRPTLIRSDTGDIFSRGSFWIEPSEGRLVRTRLTVGDSNTEVRAEVTVTYRPDERLGVWVPGEMVEVYDRPTRERSNVIHGTATYSKFRTFQVQVEETFEEDPDAHKVPPKGGA